MVHTIYPIGAVSDKYILLLKYISYKMVLVLYLLLHFDCIS